MSPPAIQSVALPNSKEPGYSPIYRNVTSAEQLTPNETSEVTTLFESFGRSVKLLPKNHCLGHREYDRATKVRGPYTWQTYEQVQIRRDKVGGGLVNIFEQ